MPEQAAAAACNRCGGTGWVIVERDGISGADRCDCVRVGRSLRVERAAGIPPTYQNASFDNFMLPTDNPVARGGLGTVLLTVKNFVREFPNADRPGLLL